MRALFFIFYLLAFLTKSDKVSALSPEVSPVVKMQIMAADNQIKSIDPYSKFILSEADLDVSEDNLGDKLKDKNSDKIIIGKCQHYKKLIFSTNFQITNYQGSSAHAFAFYLKSASTPIYIIYRVFRI